MNNEPQLYPFSLAALQLDFNTGVNSSSDVPQCLFQASACPLSNYSFNAHGTMYQHYENMVSLFSSSDTIKQVLSLYIYIHRMNCLYGSMGLY